MFDFLNFTTATVFIAAVAWMVRTVVVHFLSKDTTAHEVHLRHTCDIEIERLRNALNRQRLEYELRVSRVDEMVANSLSEVYNRLCELRNAVWDFVHQAPKNDHDYDGKEQRVEVVQKALAETLQRNRINLPQELWEETRRYSVAMDKAVEARWTARQAEREQQRGAACHKMEEAVNLLGDARGLLDSIVVAYQERLGISENAQEKGGLPSTRAATRNG
jgi:hypothetical protein